MHEIVQNSLNAEGRPNKSQQKRDIQALRELGKQLISLPREQLNKMGLPAELYEAIILAQNTSGREGRKRQMLYVGKVLRKIDSKHIKSQLEARQHGSKENTANMHRIESLRDLLINDDNALTEFLAEYPDTDIQKLRATIRAARSEKQKNDALEPDSNKTPQRKHYRALYQILKEIMESI